MPRRKTAARIDLAGNESHDAWASGQRGVTTRIPLGSWARRVQGRESVAVAVNPAPARTRRRRRGVGVGAGALSGQEARDMRARARAWVRMHIGVTDTGLGPARIENGRRRRSLGRRHGWRRTRRPQLGTNTRGWKRRPVAKRALAGQEGGAPSSAFACARQPSTARPWRRGRQEWKLEVRRTRERERAGDGPRRRPRWGGSLRLEGLG
jgi:hypothetical protein